MNIKKLFFAGLLASNIVYANDQITKIIPLHHINADVCASILNGIKDYITVTSRPENNSLIITGTPNDCSQMEQVIEMCDYPRPKIAGIAVYLADGTVLMDSFD